MSCPQRWAHGGGVHQCRHTEGHETRRHSCQCGSWPGERGATPISPTQPTTPRLGAWGRAAAGGECTPLPLVSRQPVT